MHAFFYCFYTNAFYFGNFSIFFARVSEEDVEVVIDPALIPGHNDYVASMRGCMMTLMQKHKNSS